MDLRADVSATFTADGADAFTVHAGVDVDAGETLVILGPSGSGKTLLLETIAGFHDHDGFVESDGRRLDTVPPEDRDFGFVFQDYALFPHLSVTENVEYGTKYHDETRDAETLLAELGVDHLADRYPPTLSGGEKQRVALARALAVRPSVMLLDEPLAALDVPTRQSLRDDLADVLADVTAVYVTHNRTTARAIADRIAVMRDGQVVQTGTPETVFERPSSPVVAEFTGANAVPLSAVPSLRDAVDGATDEYVAFRPEAVRLDGASGDFEATVERVVREDATNRVVLSLDGRTVDAFADDPPAVGADVWVSVDPGRVHPCSPGTTEE
ncbi:ABC transporter ATP-binding protein [Halomicroarcula sp. F13]|uniref:Molybdate/tungstate import ATP-binding protein WtpC n=1 Tax=Haloarcula rubra TaxID=2487747 RepID=A0AAW4PP79_9EURY|nr:ABC transporter ATP-binding protein [Halomicroarcula rubra]MBX0322197.1 ABC transporter ATP-binding protein [Halomicroarcula rubra]